MQKSLILLIEEKKECLDLLLDKAKLDYAECCLNRMNEKYINEKEGVCHIIDAQIKMLDELLISINI